MYFPADEVARKMKYYIVNRGDVGVEQTNWTFVFHKRQVIHPGISFVVRGSVSAEHEGSLFSPHSIPFHSRPGKRKRILFGLAELVLHTYGRNQSGCKNAKKMGFLPSFLWVFLSIYIFVALMNITMCFKKLEASYIMS